MNLNGNCITPGVLALPFASRAELAHATGIDANTIIGRVKNIADGVHGECIWSKMVLVLGLRLIGPTNDLARALMQGRDVSQAPIYVSKKRKRTGRGICDGKTVNEELGEASEDTALTIDGPQSMPTLMERLARDQALHEYSSASNPRQSNPQSIPLPHRLAESEVSGQQPLNGVSSNTMARLSFDAMCKRPRIDGGASMDAALAQNSHERPTFEQSYSATPGFGQQRAHDRVSPFFASQNPRAQEHNDRALLQTHAYGQPIPVAMPMVPILRSNDGASRRPYVMPANMLPTYFYPPGE